MDDEISILFFCHSLDSRLRLLLSLMKVLLEFSLSGHGDTLQEIVGLAGSGIDLMVLFFFCDFLNFLLEVGYVERPETIVVW
jgi:hypothetical protein